MRSEPKNATASPVRDTASLAFPCCRVGFRGRELGEGPRRKSKCEPPWGTLHLSLDRIGSYQLVEAGHDSTPRFPVNFMTPARHLENSPHAEESPWHSRVE